MDYPKVLLVKTRFEHVTALVARMMQMDSRMRTHPTYGKRSRASRECRAQQRSRTSKQQAQQRSRTSK
jgi:hypothetical protein